MGTHEYYSRVRVLLTRHFLMGTRGPRVLVEALLPPHPQSSDHFRHHILLPMEEEDGDGDLDELDRGGVNDVRPEYESECGDR